MLKKGIIFDIKRYALHDGPGIRTTVFLKGCPLQCPWCHNPEGEHPEPEIVWHRKRCQAQCRDCVSVCPQTAIQKKGKIILVDRTQCDLCGVCTEVCSYQALEIIGREVTVREVMEEVLKDRVFYEESHGGVTFSGGEPFLQPEFLEALLQECRRHRIHTAVDTCGYIPTALLGRTAAQVDLFLYDLKFIDQEKHQQQTSVSNRIILENLLMLSDKGKDIVIRIPLVKDVNDGLDNMRQTVEFLLGLKNVREVNLLPYHRGGEEKFKRLGRKHPRRAFKPSSKTRIQNIERIFEDQGFTVKTGG